MKPILLILLSPFLAMLMACGPKPGWMEVLYRDWDGADVVEGPHGPMRVETMKQRERYLKGLSPDERETYLNDPHASMLIGKRKSK